MKLLKGFGCVLLVAVSLSPLCAEAANKKETEQWRLAEAFGLPDWLDISGTHRTRYETLGGQFRTGRSSGDQMLAFRTTLRLELKSERFSVVVEMIDSRQELAGTGSPINNTMVDAVDLLQGYGAIRFDKPFAANSCSELCFGRQTMNVGSRRFVARNDFRNTINAFTGLHYQWQLECGPTLRTFYVLPVNRLPSDPHSLLDNEIEFDDGSFDVQFWGLHAQWAKHVLGRDRRSVCVRLARG